MPEGLPLHRPALSALALRTFAEAKPALRAMSRRCSAVMVFRRALPPRLPSFERCFDNTDLPIVPGHYITNPLS